MSVIKKIGTFIASRALYLLIGLFLALAIFSIQAAWNNTVSSGQPLTSSLWNDIVAKLIELDSRPVFNIVRYPSDGSKTGNAICSDYGLTCLHFDSPTGYDVMGCGYTGPKDPAWNVACY